MKHTLALSGRSARRRRLLQRMAAGIAGGLSGLLQQALAAESSAVRQGFHRVSGTVIVNGQPATEGMLVLPGATAITEAASEAIYVVGQDAYLQRAGGQVVISSGGAAGVFRVITGAVLSVFGRGPREISIPGATVGIRGTGCYVEIEKSRTYFCLCYGGAVLAPDGGQPHSYSTKHHEQPFWIEDGKLTPAGMLNHEDTELALLESLVSRQVPFTIPYTR